MATTSAKANLVHNAHQISADPNAELKQFEPLRFVLAIGALIIGFLFSL